MHNGRLLERVINSELAPVGLHHGQGRMLQVIERCGPITQADLARRMDVKPATVTHMLKPLMGRTLVLRATDPKTNRALVVSLTPAGRRASRAVLDAWGRVEQRLNTAVSDEKKDGFLKGLETIREIVSDANAKEEQ